jgi:hypothetical protein
MNHSIFNPDIAAGAYASERDRYERIFLERREHNRQGHKPRPMPATPDARPRTMPARYRDFPGAAETPSIPSPPRASGARAAPEPAPVRAPKSVERRLSLEDMARAITGKGRRK